MRADSARKMLNRCATIHQTIPLQITSKWVFLRSAAVEDHHLREQKKAENREREFQLAAQIYAGSEEAWIELWERLKKPAWCYVAESRVEARDVEDLVSESLESLCRAIKKGQFDPKEGTVRAYFYTIMGNLVATYKRRKQRGVPEGDGDELNGEPLWNTGCGDPQDVEFEKSEEAEMLRTALRCLSPKTQEIVELRFWKGYSEEEISQKLGMTHGSVRKRVSRGYEDLRKILLDKGMLP